MTPNMDCSRVGAVSKASPFVSGGWPSPKLAWNPLQKDCKLERALSLQNQVYK